MFKQIGKKSALSLIAAGSLMLSASAFAISGGGNDGGGGDDGGCESDCGFERGPDPSVSILESSRGPYSVRTSNVSSFVSGFGGGTIHYPTGTTGTMAAVVVIPGFASSESSIAWWGPKLASHGFVVMTIDTNSGFDQPASRANQINSALDYLIDQSNSGSSAISGMVDTTRLGVVGWSMGGGGTLRVATEGRIKAAIPLAPWDTSSLQFRSISTPTLIFACENDTIAPVRSHADPFYDAIPDSTDKAFVEINGGSHYCGNGGNSYNDVLSRLGVSWMKLHLDQDQRYNEFVCGPRHESDRDISEYRGTCPY
ncbi:alpha/beta hydrolase family protein [Marinobacter zhanjiangensis]|uniref:Lipase n=1 Tax=Marinobacter zhanjiangensis TaxID=578215 RepID=A0ABQ3B5M7_9GAMM|nr:dienelactone hydrolase family protein [Marinobacter zhanjiangensis]GGY74990.1 lipase [Marinobacter zhanjiangensis]